MKTILLFSMFFISLSSFIFGQEVVDSFKVVKLNGSEIRYLFKSGQISYWTKTQRYQIYHNNEPISAEAAKMKMESNSQAYVLMDQSIEQMDSFDDINRTGLIYVEIGSGIFILFALLGDPPMAVFLTYTAFFFGGAIIMFSIQASHRSKSYKLASQAVEVYNNGLRNIPKRPQSTLSMGLMGNGIGMRVNF